jgi:PAS domain S-box-containing protein
MAIQSQTLASDASQLSNSLDNQAHQTNETNILLIVSLVGTFGALLATIYLMIFRRTLKSVEQLQKGINTIGSGNLDYVIETNRNDEISELSESFNQMTTNLKTVTASKTDLEQAQASLRESEQRWSTTLASIGDAVIATDLSGKIVFMNAVAEELTGWTLNEASLKLVKEVFNIVNEQTRFEVENPVSKVLAEGMIVGLANHTVLIRKNKTEVAIDDSGAPIKDKDGKTTGVVLIFRDITERKKAEEALKESEQIYHTVFDNSQDGFQLIELMYDEKGKPYDHKFLKVNKAYEKIIGVRAEDILDKTARYISPNDEPHWFDVPDRVLRTGKSEHVELYNKDINKTLDCYYFPYAKNVVGTLFRDVTERKNMEKKLQDQERLAAIGATAGMVGHDIRNPLQAITGDLFLAKSELSELPENENKTNAIESLDEIQNNIDYINKIVADLQDYARPLNPRAQETNIKSLFHEILAKNGIPKNIKVTVKVEDKAEKIMADPDYLKRIAANLTLNAVQAMPNGGKLTIRAYSEKQTNDVLITVKDTGVGIPEDIKPKLFTPMMTTKSKGQGFGLAVVKRMTEGLGGTVAFESTEGKGTTFIVRLPPPKS